MKCPTNAVVQRHRKAIRRLVSFRMQVWNAFTPASLVMSVIDAPS
jgi:hypothetical protein